ncbi:hypothetical protein EV190_102257 [Actinorugispora endophytica]|uniref:Glycosyl hydrolase family 28 n=1 Tax=Actinorugispora endophytica TaxID=1605990 RepID=A0A4R6V342_9ACTN|nr:hypothetical protein EV190_102257 [Actinorugispora endophytica]
MTLGPRHRGGTGSLYRFRNSDVAIRNLTVTNTAIRESPCGDDVTFGNITRVNSSLDVC